MEIFFVLVRPKYSINIGFSARAIKNFGFKNLILVNPIANIDEKAKMFSAHAYDVLVSAKIYNTLEEVVRREKLNYLVGTTARIGGDKNPRRTAITSDLLRDISIPEDTRLGILFGNEEHGLTNEELSFCDIIVTIPSSEDYPVLNLSHAVAIIAYELSLMLKNYRKLRYRPSTREERAILLDYLHKILDILDIPKFKHRIYRGILRNLVNRPFLTGREVYSLIGFFKKIYEKLSEGSNINLSN